MIPLLIFDSRSKKKKKLTTDLQGIWNWLDKLAKRDRILIQETVPNMLNRFSHWYNWTI